jgi:leucyl aminopeptidase (aminopeptidase T)
MNKATIRDIKEIFKDVFIEEVLDFKKDDTIVKTLTEDGDSHNVGEIGTFIGAIEEPIDYKNQTCYICFVQFNTDLYPVAIASFKITKI